MLVEVLGWFRFTAEGGVWANAQGSRKCWFFLALSSCQPVSTTLPPPSPEPHNAHGFPRCHSKDGGRKADTWPAFPLRDPRQALLMGQGSPPLPRAQHRSAPGGSLCRPVSGRGAKPTGHGARVRPPGSSAHDEDRVCK